MTANTIYCPPAIIENGRVRIYVPNADVYVEAEVKRKNGNGAVYARRWDKLPVKLQEIITVWMSDPTLRNAALTKVDLLHEIRRNHIRINDDPFNARISELVGLGIVLKTAEIKSSPHNTRNPPTYRLDVCRAARILNDGGKL